MIESLDFETLEFNSRKQVLVGTDTTGKFLIKIEVVKNSNKERDIQEEYEILKHLNDSGCNTCPVAHELGVISKDDISSKVKEKEILDATGKSDFYYIIQDYLPDRGDYTLADIILTLIEQKKLGVYQGDVKRQNIRFDPAKKICYFIDYDQAITLSPEQVELDNTSFLELCSDYDKKHGFGDWLRHFPKYDAEDVSKLFVEEAFNLGQTTIFKTQNTTNTDSGMYHAIREKDIFIDGPRDINVRANLLDQVEFRPNEQVLDIGCNAGLLSWYLEDRECEVIGVDNDPHIIVAARIISNILGRNASYYYLDVDKVDEINGFDTVMLFSVLHHTRDIAKNAKKISASCSRIILEARPVENGKQPVSAGHWRSSSNWSFGGVDELVNYCESIFTGFKLRKNLGIGSKNRYILEFVK